MAGERSLRRIGVAQSSSLPLEWPHETNHFSFVGFNVPSESPIPPLFISDQEQMWFRRDLKPDDFGEALGSDCLMIHCSLSKVQDEQDRRY